MRKVRRFQISLVAIVTVFLGYPQGVMSQESVVPSTIGEIVRFENRMDELIPSDAKIELLASGFEWRVSSILRYTTQLNHEMEGRGRHQPVHETFRLHRCR